MRCLSKIALVLGLLMLGAGSISGQGKDKDKAKDKDSKKDPAGQFPTDIGGKDLNQWIAEIKDTDPTNRQTAIRTLVHFGPAAQKAVKTLAGRLYSANESDASVRADAAAAIGMLGLADLNTKDRDTVIGDLVQALSDSQRPVRLQVANTLARIGPDAKAGGDPRAIAKLGVTVQDEISWEVRFASAHALSILGRDAKGADEKAVAALINALPDRCASVRMEAIRALSIIGAAPTEKQLDREKKALGKRLLDEKDHRVTIWVRVLLMFLDEKNYMTKTEMDKLAKELTNNDAKVKVQAAQALGTLGSKASLQAPALTAAVADKNQDVQLAAIAALPRVAGAGCIPLLSKLLKDEKEQLAIRVQIIHSVPVLGESGKVFVDELAVLLINKDPDLVAAAINSLAAFGDVAQPAIPALKNFDPKQLTFEAQTKDANKNVLEEVNRTREAIKAAADEAIKHISESKPKAEIKPKK